MTTRRFAAFSGMSLSSLFGYEHNCQRPSATRLIALLRLAETADEYGPIMRALEAQGVALTDFFILLPGTSITSSGCHG